MIQSNETHHDLVQTVGKEYLGVDDDTDGKPKKRKAGGEKGQGQGIKRESGVGDGVEKKKKVGVKRRKAVQRESSSRGD